MTAVSPLRTTTMVVTSCCSWFFRLAREGIEEGAALVFLVDMSRELLVEFPDIARLAGGLLDEDARERPHIARQALLGRGQHLRRELRLRRDRHGFRRRARIGGHRPGAPGGPAGRLYPVHLLQESLLLVGVGGLAC